MLTQHLKTLIAEQGPLRLDAFLNEVLYHPSFGYYSHCIPMGKDGDYTTAPEITQVFGEMLGAWILETWQQAGMRTPIHLIELGPGLGTLMGDMLRIFKLRPVFLNNLNIHLIDVSPLLIAKQKHCLSAYSTIHWHQSLDSVPDGYTIILGNEFFDALPIRQFLKTNGSWCERYVTTTADTFDFTTLPCAPLSDAPETLPDNILVERCQAAEEIAEIIARRLLENGGFGLFIDYGEETGTWIGDTLQTLHQHQKQSIFANLGRSDITHHVDFKKLKSIFEKNGLTTYGTTTQGQFLKTLGIETRAQHLSKSLQQIDQIKLNLALLRLMGCKEMGQLFKVLAIATPSLAAVGFDDTNL